MLRAITLPRNEQISPLVDPGNVTGFASPARDYKKLRIEITERLIRDTENTYIFIAVGNGLQAFGIMEGDLVIVDKSLPRSLEAQLVCFTDNHYTVVEIIKDGPHIYLSDRKTTPISIQNTKDTHILWGAITYVCSSRTVKKKHVRTS